MRSFVAAGPMGPAIGIFLTALGPLTAGCGDSAQRRHDAALQAQLAADQQKANQEAARAQALQAQLQTRAAESQTLQQRVEQLRKVAEERARLFNQLTKQLEAMISAGNVTVEMRHGEMVVALPNDVLFDSGRTEIKPAGKRALIQVAAALKAVPDRRFDVSGHTDSVPLKLTSQYRNNWELSGARALTVLEFLVAQGMDEHRLATEGHADTLPAADNTSENGRRLNRRIEIVLEPKLDELPEELRAFRQNRG